MNHVMLDLETLGTKPTAGILSIGAVKFDLERGEIGPEFYAPVRIQSCIDLGLTIDGDILSFWAQQPEPARQVFWDQTAGDLQPVLISLRAWVLNYPLEGSDPETYPCYLWGNGAGFDNIILRNAFRVCQFDFPFQYRDDLCYRTLKFLYRLKFPDDKSSTDKPHHALDDARLQVVRAIEMWRKIKPILADSLNVGSPGLL